MDIFKNLPSDLWSKIIIFVCQMRIIECYKKISNGNDEISIRYFDKIDKEDKNSKIIKMNLQYFKVPQMIKVKFHPISSYRRLRELIDLFKNIADYFDLTLDEEILNTINNFRYDLLEGNYFYFYLVDRNIKSFIVLDITILSDFNIIDSVNPTEYSSSYIYNKNSTEFKILSNEIINTEELGEETNDFLREDFN
jgi:hypothetical protein